MFFCCFVCCLFVVLGLWYTFVASNIFLRVPKTDSDFRCTEKLEFTVDSRQKQDLYYYSWHYYHTCKY